MKWYVVSVEEIVLEMDGHQSSILPTTKHIPHHSGWHSLTVVGTFHISVFRVASPRNPIIGSPALSPILGSWLSCVSPLLLFSVLATLFLDLFF